MKKIQWFTFPLIFVAVAIAVALAWDLTQPAPITAAVVGPTVELEDGATETRVQWETPEGTVEAAPVTLPAAYSGSKEVPIFFDGDGVPVVSTGDLGNWAYVAISLIAGTLGLTVWYGVNGYGYIRGTGQVSETPDLDVSEERGFYWRT